MQTRNPLVRLECYEKGSHNLRRKITGQMGEIHTVKTGPFTELVNCLLYCKFVDFLCVQIFQTFSQGKQNVCKKFADIS